MFSEKKLSISQVWGNAFVAYRKTFFRVWPIVLLPKLLLALIGFLFAHSFPKGNAIFNAHVFWGEGITLLLVWMLLSTLFVYLYMIAFYRAHAIVAEKSSTLLDSCRGVNVRFFAILMASFMMLVLGGVGFLCLIIPAIFLGLAQGFVAPSILFDGLGWWAGIKRACALVWWNWWSTFLVFFVPGILITILFFFVGLASTLPFFLTGHARYAWVGGIIMQGAVSVTVPYFMVLLLVQFYNLKAIKLEQTQRKV